MRYLLYYEHGTVSAPAWQQVGIRHLYTQLQTLCQEAAWLGRTPVFPRIAPLDLSHNAGIPCKFPLGKYLDTQNIELVCKLDGKTRMLSLGSIHEKQLRELKIPAEETLEIAAGEPVTASQNRHFRLVARRFYTPVWYREMSPLPVESFAHEAPPAQDLELGKSAGSCKVILQPSPRVRKRAADIIRQLPPHYCAVHIRRGDTLKFPAVRAMTSPGAVSRALAQAGVAPDAPLYLMSDENSRHWLHALRKQWPGLLHYTDFPRLVQLVRPNPNPPPPPPLQGEGTTISCFAWNNASCNTRRECSSPAGVCSIKIAAGSTGNILSRTLCTRGRKSKKSIIPWSARFHFIERDLNKPFGGGKHNIQRAKSC